MAFNFCLFCNIVIFNFSFVRDISPKNGQEVFFSHELYEKYSLSLSLSELWHLSNRYIILSFCSLHYHSMDPHTVLGKAACCLAYKDLLLSPWASSWPVLYLL